MNSLEQLCLEKQVDYEQTLAVLELYDSDEDEEIVLEKIYLYPENVRELVSTLILPIVS